MQYVSESQNDLLTCLDSEHLFPLYSVYSIILSYMLSVNPIGMAFHECQMSNSSPSTIIINGKSGRICRKIRYQLPPPDRAKVL